METIRLMAKSSSGAPYEVVFRNTGSDFYANCSCQGAVNGLLCKHVKGLLSGDAKLLADGADWDGLEKVLQWVVTSELPAMIKEHESALKQVTKAQAEEKQIKKRLSKAILEGVKLIGRNKG